MANVRVELNIEGVRELLRSDEMKSICEGHANAALTRLGDGYETSSMVGKNRVNAEIKAVSYKAKIDNLKNNSILKALR